MLRFARHMLRKASPSVLYKLKKKSLSLWPALGMENCLFESVVSSPRTVFIVVPENNICRQQSFSCPLSATIAVMKTGPAGKGLRGTSPPPQSWSVRSGRLAGPPPGRLLEDGRQRRRVSTAYLHADVILKVAGRLYGQG